MKPFSDKDCQEVLKESEEHTVLLFFNAPWCAPCHKARPLVDELSHDKDIQVYDVDVSKCPETVVMFGVRSVPTLLRLVNRDVAGQHVGSMARDAIEALLR